MLRYTFPLQALRPDPLEQRFRCFFPACPACRSYQRRRARAFVPALPPLWRAAMARQWRILIYQSYRRPDFRMAGLGLLFGHASSFEARERWLALLPQDEAALRLVAESGWGYMDPSLTRAAVPVLANRFSYEIGRHFGVPWQARLDGLDAFGRNAMLLPRLLRLPGDRRHPSRYALTDAAHRLLYPPELLEVGAYTQVGRSGVWLAAAQAQDGLWGYLDLLGRWAIPPQLRDAGSFRADAPAPVWLDAGGAYLSWAGMEATEEDGGVTVDPLWRQHGLNMRLERTPASEVSRDDFMKDARLRFNRSPLWSGGQGRIERDLGQWGIIDARGRVTLPWRQREPLTDESGRVIGFDDGVDLSPWWSRDGALEWLDTLGRTRFRLTRAAEGTADVTLSLSDGRGRVLWRSEPILGGVLWQARLRPQAEELASRPKYWHGGLAETARQLLTQPTRPFFLTYYDFDDKDAQFYELERLGEWGRDPAAPVPQGAVLGLARHYADPALYDPLFPGPHPQFLRLFRRFSAQLERAFGPSEDSPEPAGLGVWAARDEALLRTWRSGERRLTLAYGRHGLGDGREFFRIVLIAFAP